MFKPSQTDHSVSVTRGFNMGFGALSRGILATLGEELLKLVLGNCVPKGKVGDDAETRREAVNSLGKIIRTFGIRSIGPHMAKEIYETLKKCLDDYEVDRRGDVGSYVRKVAMLNLKDFLEIVIDAGHQPLIDALGCDKKEFFQEFVALFIQQLMEKIDQIREVAGRCLQYFFKHVAPKAPEFAEKAQLNELFMSGIDSPEHDLKFIDWREPKFIFKEMR